MHVLCMCPLGPPLTGQTSISNEVVRFFREHGHSVAVIDKKVLPGGWRKTAHYAASLVRVLWHLAFLRRPRLAYLTISRSAGGFLRDAVFIALCWLRGVPVLNHVHGSDLPALLGQPLIGRIALRLLNTLAASIMLSRAMAADVEAAGLRHVIVIRNFAPPEYFAVPRPRRGVAQPLRILYLSNVMQAKGVFDLIEACRLLEREAPHFELHIVGRALEGTRALQDQTRSALIELAEQHRFVRWHGPLYGEDKVRAYADADIFCLPSHQEAAPLTLLDAMAAGLPCVVTSVGGVPEIVMQVQDGVSALVVPAHEPSTLADRLLELVGSPELRQHLGERAREHARKHFTLERFRREFGTAVAAAVRAQGPG
jgi:glycosyltransferase involved in cell wall biosynthesis